MLQKIEVKYNYAIDIIRSILIISVILIHCSTKSLELVKYDFLGNFLTFYLNQATRFTVPLFFFISAFVLELSHPQNLSFFPYIKQRFSKIFLPYLFWSAIYMYWVYPNPNGNFIFALLSGSASYQLYFIPALFILYLIFPFIHNHIHFLKRKIFLIILGLLQILLLANDYYFHPLNLPQPIGVFLLNFDVYILGALASKYQNEILAFLKKYYIFLIIFVVFISLFITGEAWTLYRYTKNYLTFYSNWRPLAFIYSLAVGALLFSTFNNISHNFNIIKKIASYSFFVYFIHIIYIEIIWKILPNSLLSFTLIPFLIVTLVSYLSAFLIHKIPQISKITG